MVRHTVMLRWKDGTTREQVASVESGLGSLPAIISEIKRYEFGPDLGLADTNFDFVLVADFDSVEDFKMYATQPDHVAVIEMAIAPIVAEAQRVQYEL